METQQIQQSAQPELPRITVLIEEESIIRHLWSEHYRKNGLPLEVFENPLDFLKQIERFRNREQRIHFFFDQDFGRVRGVGVQLARAVRHLNKRQSVSLITRYLPSLFHQELSEGLVQSVFDKYPEHIFGPDFDIRQFSENPKLWEIKERRWSELNPIEMELGSSGDGFEFTLEKHFPSLAPKKKEKPIVSTPTARPAQKKSIPVKDSWWRKFIFGGTPA